MKSLEKQDKLNYSLLMLFSLMVCDNDCVEHQDFGLSAI